MLRINPFVMGHLVGAVLVGGAAGTLLLDARAGLICAVSLLAGAFVSSYVCQWWPGVEAPGWKLWAVAVFASPIMLLALGYIAFDYECTVGTRRGWNCLLAAIAIVMAGLCLLPPAVGLLWRWWKHRKAPPPAASS